MYTIQENLIKELNCTPQTVTSTAVRSDRNQPADIPFEVGRVLLASGNSSTDVANLVEIGASVGYVFSCCNWIVYAAVSRSYRKAYVRMFEKLRVRLCAVSNE